MGHISFPYLLAGRYAEIMTAIINTRLRALTPTYIEYHEAAHAKTRHRYRALDDIGALALPRDARSSPARRLIFRPPARARLNREVSRRWTTHRFHHGYHSADSHTCLYRVGWLDARRCRPPPRRGTRCKAFQRQAFAASPLAWRG